MSRRTVLCISATEAEARWLTDCGPRRDFVELAARTGGELFYRSSAPARRGLFGKLTGPHIRHAWRVAAAVDDGDAIYADGEHSGLPLLFFLALRRKTRTHVVMIGHNPGRWWKRLLLRGGTRIGPAGELLVHSVEQARRAGPSLGPRWRMSLLPYHVDAGYWSRRTNPPQGALPVVLAVGAEHRDYDTLVRAADGLRARVVIVAGSHWARTAAGAGSALPANVLQITEKLSFDELRSLYETAAVVVVPLRPASFQAGVTTILEGMSMAKPVVVTATDGQRECVTGPLVRSDGVRDAAATADRGPAALGLDAAGAPADGLYVPAGDSAALRHAIAGLLAGGATARTMGEAGRAAAERHFGIDAYTERLATALGADTAPREASAEAVAS